ncbi:MAG: NAD(P)/FAD-dependent oxidoreductase [Thermoplasmataceae archaeon]
MEKKYDVVIIGAGISGLSTALHIKEENHDLSIVVIDKQNSYGQGNTGKSAAGFRDIFKTKVNRQLASTSVEFYKKIQKSLGFDIGLHFNGYLFLSKDKSPMDAMLQELSSSVKIDIVDKDEIKSSLNIEYELDPEQRKLMNLEGYDKGYVGRNCGIIEPELLADYYFKECAKLGIEFDFGTTVSGLTVVPTDPLDYPGEPFIWQKKKIGTLQTNKGTYSGDEYIMAADVYTTGLLDKTGIDGHERPKKRQVFQVTNDKIVGMLSKSVHTDENIMPFTILPSHGVFLRPAPKYRSMWIGVADDLARDFTMSEDPQPERDFYENSIYQILTSYCKNFEGASLTGSWAGYYSYNTADMTPNIFKELNLTVISGTSGSGIMKGDAIGRAAAAVFSGKEKAKLYGNVEFQVSDIGVSARKIQMEQLIL